VPRLGHPLQVQQKYSVVSMLVFEFIIPVYFAARHKATPYDFCGGTSTLFYFLRLGSKLHLNGFSSIYFLIRNKSDSDRITWS